MDVPIGDEKETVEKDQSTLEMRNVWSPHCSRKRMN
jgi:hypothetical protein